MNRNLSAVITIRHIFLLLIFVGLSLPSAVLSAQIEMNHFLGFNGFFKLNSWTPLNIVLNNNGKAIDSDLEVVIRSGSEFFGDVRDTTYETHVDLPANSNKLFSFTIYIDSFIHPLSIRLIENGKQIISTSINLRPYYKEKNLILFPVNQGLSDIFPKFDDHVEPVIPRVQFLPETWYGYDGIESIILKASDLSEFRENQFSALASWIRSGGYLILSGDINYGSFSNEHVQNLLPLNIKRVKNLTELRSLEDFCGRALLSKIPIPIIEAEIEGAEVLLKQDDINIILQKKVGFGKIIYTGFDLQSAPFIEWAGFSLFWRKILALKPQAIATVFKWHDNEILTSMVMTMPIRFQSSITVIAFLFCYLFIIHIIFKQFMKTRTHSWKKIILLLMVVLIFAAASGWSYYDRNKNEGLTYNSFHHLKLNGNDKIASSEYILGLYTLKAGNINLDPGPSAEPINAAFSGESIIGTEHDIFFNKVNRKNNVQFSMPKWSKRFLKISSVLDLPIKGSAVKDRQGVTVTIDNQLPLKLIDSQAFMDGSIIPFGDIKPGGKLIKRISVFDTDQKKLSYSRSSSPYAEEMIPGEIVTLYGRIQEDLIGYLLSVTAPEQADRQDVIRVFGWTLTKTSPSNIEGKALKGEDVTLIEMEIPIINSAKDSLRTR